ncbi:FAD-binding oxidoreductase [Paraburkholderia fynbosensis]|uniref:Putative FAD-linked oxidoreductase n=1 Tax=Paraburkholderia fynbosensis TaxID=1200993 RepID=A0A6J5GVC8_9BURK|nr:FAD-binding oxidoreductase [Paraburkholderia fynbosensis]CAB3806953.1 putative FAD-linked oxidoreductase [Paraburkholderia fynbosensis]
MLKSTADAETIGDPIYTALKEPEKAKWLLDRLIAIVGKDGVITDPSDVAPYMQDMRGKHQGKTSFVVRPSTTQQVAEVVKICAATATPIIPQGGNTGLVCGGIPLCGGNNVLLSLQRMNRIVEVDAVGHTMTVEAGCILANVQEAAREAGLLFPLSLASEGSCRIGGNLSTNAGGIAVLHYGNARDLVLGIEVVLPDGRIWNGLRGLRKDNSGYDLKHLFIGGEGTLGIITAATLKIFPQPVQVETALLAVRDIECVMGIYARARAASGDRLTAFELIPRVGLEFGLKHVPGTIEPFDRAFPYYVLAQISSSEAGDNLRSVTENVLTGILEAELAEDAILAESIAQAKGLWGIREGVVEGHRFEGAVISHDVSVPIAKIAEFVRKAGAAAELRCAGIRVIAFGHVGDGNIHFNFHQPVGTDGKEFLARAPEFNELVYDIAVGMGGSISAEHGIGYVKKSHLRKYRSDVELDLMRRIKLAIDEKNIMNPGKIFD